MVMCTIGRLFFARGGGGGAAFVLKKGGEGEGKEIALCDGHYGHKCGWEDK